MATNGLGEDWMLAGGEASAMETDGDMITVTVRAPKHRKDFDVMNTTTVKQLKEQIVGEFSSPLDQQCVIFAGKILKDYELLKDCGVTNGQTVHLVIKSAQRSDDVLTSFLPGGEGVEGVGPLPPADIGVTPFGLASVGGLAGLSSIGMGSANFIDLQQSLQKELFRNPGLLKSLMSNPLVKQITSSPGLVLQLLNANPQMRELMEKNPEIGQMLSNTEVMKQMLDVARTPAMLLELLRPQDRPVSFTNDGTVGAEGEAVKEEQKKTSGVGSSGASEIPSVPSDGEPGVRSLMLQMLDQPQLMTNVLQSSYVQSILQHMTENPQLLTQMLGYNQIVAGNPALHEQITQNLPTMCQQLSSPEVQGLVTNPRALRAMLQIQEGMEELRAEAPELVTRLGFAPSMLAAHDGSDGATHPHSQFLSHILTNNMAAGSNVKTENVSDVQKYSIQLNQLSLMGFIDSEENLQGYINPFNPRIWRSTIKTFRTFTLISTSGNVNEAINKMLQSRKEA